MNKYIVMKKLTAVFKGLMIFLVSFIILLPLYWIFISSITCVMPLDLQSFNL